MLRVEYERKISTRGCHYRMHTRKNCILSVSIRVSTAATCSTGFDSSWIHPDSLHHLQIYHDAFLRSTQSILLSSYDYK
jgi:hypothetical protein